MNGTSLSPYRYLTFLLPGALLLFTVVYGWAGWTWGEPGIASTLGLTVASFVVGHVVVAIANFFQPVWWGHVPGGRLASSEGLFDKAGRYAKSETQIRAALQEALPQVEGFDAQFGLAYQKAQKGPLAAKLQSIVEEIGYYRSMATAAVISSLIVAVFNSLGRHDLPAWPWIPALVAVAATHAYRFRRFWRYVAEYVVAEVLGDSRDSRRDNGGNT